MIEPNKQQPALVREYDLEHLEGICLPYDFSKDYLRFREIINDTNNGIPEALRQDLAKIYGRAGKALESSYVYASTDFCELEGKLETVLVTYYDMEHYDAALAALGLENEKNAALLLRQSYEEIISSTSAENFQNRIDETLLEVVHTALKKKIEEGALPEMETDNKDFDLA
jgi:hypothetical protein